MAVTVVDVAREAGVSKSTAARALAGSPGVSPEAHRRVHLAAEQLGYRANRMASALRSGESRLIGLLVTNLVNASIQAIIEVVQERARAEGYQVLLGVTGGDSARESTILETLIDHRVDGVILMGTGENTDQVNTYAADGLPVVNLIRRPRGGITPAVLPDNYHGADEATRYLLDLGHRAIAFIGGPLDVASGHERFAGFRSALEESGLAVRDDLVRRGLFDRAFGYAAATELLESGQQFTAVFVTNHEAIHGVLAALAERRVRIPDDLSIIGFEDFHWFATWNPPITIVDIDPDRLGNTTIDVLLREIRSGTPPSPDVERTNARLIIRESCARPRTARLAAAT